MSVRHRMSRRRKHTGRGGGSQNRSPKSLLSAGTSWFGLGRKAVLQEVEEFFAGNAGREKQQASRRVRPRRSSAWTPGKQIRFVCALDTTPPVDSPGSLEKEDVLEISGGKSLLRDLTVDCYGCGQFEAQETKKSEAGRAEEQSDAMGEFVQAGNRLSDLSAAEQPFPSFQLTCPRKTSGNLVEQSPLCRLSATYDCMLSGSAGIGDTEVIGFDEDDARSSHGVAYWPVSNDLTEVIELVDTPDGIDRNGIPIPEPPADEVVYTMSVLEAPDGKLSQRCSGKDKTWEMLDDIPQVEEGSSAGSETQDPQRQPSPNRKNPTLTVDQHVTCDRLCPVTSQQATARRQLPFPRVLFPEVGPGSPMDEPPAGVSPCEDLSFLIHSVALEDRFLIETGKERQVMPCNEQQGQFISTGHPAVSVPAVYEHVQLFDPQNELEIPTRKVCSKRNRRTTDIDRRKSLAGAGTKWQDGVRRSTRFRCKPLAYWRGEKLLMGRVHQSLSTVIGIKYEASPPRTWESREKPQTFKIVAFVSPSHQALVDFAAK